MPMGMLIIEPMFHYGRDVAGSGRLVLKKWWEMGGCRKNRWEVRHVIYTTVYFHKGM